MGGAALGGIALSGLSWSMLSAAEPDLPMPSSRRPLVVKPVLIHSVYKRRAQTSWRSWGGIETQQDADQEVARISAELGQLKAKADFPVKFLPVAAVQSSTQVSKLPDFAEADTVLVYAAAGDLKAVAGWGKDVILFVRHRSGPVYLWYEIVSPRYLRQHTDQQALKEVDPQDVVVDSQDEILWRLRSLCGLHNTLGTKILAIGGPSGWASPKAPVYAKEKWKLDIQTVTYPELGELIKAARQDKAEVARALKRSEQYLKSPGTTLETKREFVDNAFLGAGVPQADGKADAAITINGCMSTIMPISKHGRLSLNAQRRRVHGLLRVGLRGDSGGHSDGGDLRYPMFLNDPTYPHDGVITLAHCRMRKMDGKTAEPVRS